MQQTPPHLLLQQDSSPLCKVDLFMFQGQVLHKLLHLLIRNLQLLPLHTQLKLQLLQEAVLMCLLTTAAACTCVRMSMRMG
jgi:hypothetical protein